MSYYLQSKSLFDSLPVFKGDTTFPFAGKSAAQCAAEEHVIDYALRNVQLPSGLLARLETLVCTMTDETADQVDWLGC